MQKVKVLAGHIAFFFGVLGILWLLLILAACIPNKALKGHMEQSALSYKEKEAFSFEKGARFWSISDNYADAILLNISWNMGKVQENDGINPVLASLDTCYYDGGDFGENAGLYLNVIDDKVEANTDYTRYWHGSAMFVRLLHLIMDVKGMKWAGLVATLFLAALTVGILIRHKHYDLAGALVLSMAAVEIWNIRLSLEYQPAFLIAFMLCPLYLYGERKKEQLLTYLSVLGGTLISFFDFLTTETVVLVLPLLLVVAVRGAENRLEDFKKNVKMLFWCGVSWFFAYGGAFLVKWTASSLATGENKFAAALSSAGERMAGGLGTEGTVRFPLRIPAAVGANLTVLFGGEKRMDVPRVLIGLVVSLLILGSLFYLFYRKKGNKTALRLLGILGSVVLLRYMMLSNHSYLHEFFTYRALICPVFALLAGMTMFFRDPGGNK